MTMGDDLHHKLATVTRALGLEQTRVERLKAENDDLREQLAKCWQGNRDLREDFTACRQANRDLMRDFMQAREQLRRDERPMQRLDSPIEDDSFGNGY